MDFVRLQDFSTIRVIALQRLYRWLAFSSVQAPALPDGPALVLSAHYNGILDGPVYLKMNGSLVPVLSSQWHRNALGRWLLPGFSLTRRKDTGDAADNLAVFRAMLQALRTGSSLLFFPEGTSRLGVERLPVQRGTVLLLRQMRDKLPDVPVYFAAAHYEHPTEWRSRVKVAFDGPHGVPRDVELQQWVARGLLRAQNKAYGPAFEPRASVTRFLRGLLAPLALWPIWPAALVARWAIARKADDQNVIALWRILGGLPAALFCLVLWIAGSLLGGAVSLALAAPLSTLIGVSLWQR